MTRRYRRWAGYAVVSQAFYWRHEKLLDFDLTSYRSLVVRNAKTSLRKHRYYIWVPLRPLPSLSYTIYTRGDTVTPRTTIPFHDGRVGLHRQCSLVLCQPLHDLFSVVGAGRALAYLRPFLSRYRLGREVYRSPTGFRSVSIVRYFVFEQLVFWHGGLD